MITTTLIILWSLSLIAQICIWGFLFKKIPDSQVTVKKTSPISIIICARNEGKNLANNLPSILQQKEVMFECIVVDDDSTDDTKLVLNELKQRYPDVLHIIHREKPNEEKGKRGALLLGIEKAKFSLILLTDADCKPHTKYWASTMCNNMVSEDKKIVLGFGPYYRGKSMVNQFARYENTYTAMLYGQSCEIGIPYMGVGRNLLYHRSAIHWEILRDKSRISGDDDLMINHAASSENTTVCWDSRSYCFSEAPNSWQSFIHQKQRHLSASNAYRWRDIIWLNLINGSQSLFHLGSVILIFKIPDIIILAQVIRWTLMVQRYRILWHRMNYGDLLLRLPLLDYGLSLYFLLMVPFTLLKAKKW